MCIQPVGHQLKLSIGWDEGDGAIIFKPERQTDGRTDGWKEGWKDGWMDGRMEGWMDG